MVFPRRGALGVAQAGREAVLGGRGFALYDSSQPLRVRIVGRDTATLVRAHVPRALLPLPARRAERLLGRPLRGREGRGALLTQFFGDATAEAPTSHPSDDASRLGAVAVDLLAATLAHHLDDNTTGTRDYSAPRVLLLRVEAYIHEHLPEPDLSPQTIAAAHRISVSYLHRLFRTRETAVTELIGRRRLEWPSSREGG